MPSSLYAKHAAEPLTTDERRNLAGNKPSEANPSLMTRAVSCLLWPFKALALTVILVVMFAGLFICALIDIVFSLTPDQWAGVFVGCLAIAGVILCLLGLARAFGSF